MAVLSFVLVACPQRTEPAWPDVVRGWQTAQVELEESSRGPLAALDERARLGDAESAELAESVRVALAELGKTRATAEAEVRSGRWSPDDASARMTLALKRAEQRTEYATVRTREEKPADKEVAPANAHEARQE
ncbi:MAG: hypothetical protein JNJ54_36670 [Myxococcaceae bacterium]|nr:hypothetical protein [Myxococcaceae bacterium]